jgi:hypothetical protein
MGTTSFRLLYHIRSFYHFYVMIFHHTSSHLLVVLAYVWKLLMPSSQLIHFRRMQIRPPHLRVLLRTSTSF